jgi:2,4-dienoyl-CoA reductase-like NADH-dependent reductase (Old Yellow Enzyme family)
MTSALFSPIKLADLELANRIAVSPMCQYSANDGVADDWHMTHLGMLANFGASLLVFEATSGARSTLTRAEKRVPVGCDRAFGSMSSSQFATLFGRCLV